MKKTWQGGQFAVLAVILVVGIALVWSTRQTAFGMMAEEAKAGGGPRYTVVETQGHNLLVTDNSTNKLYFYTIGKDKPVGSPLVLRASLDLNKVGAEQLTITAHALERAEEKGK